MARITGLHQAHTITGHDHPAVSTNAARQILGRTGSGRRRVLVSIGHDPASDEELQDRLDMPANTQRPRRVELLNLGLIADSGSQRRTTSGARSTVWTITDAGRLALAHAQ